MPCWRLFSSLALASVFFDLAMTRHGNHGEPYGTMAKPPQFQLKGAVSNVEPMCLEPVHNSQCFAVPTCTHPQRLCIRLGTSYIRCRFKSLFKPTRSCWTGNPGPNCRQLALSSVSFSLSSTSWAIHKPNGYGSRLDDQNLWSPGWKVLTHTHIGYVLGFFY